MNGELGKIFCVSNAYIFCVGIFFYVKSAMVFIRKKNLLRQSCVDILSRSTRWTHLSRARESSPFVHFPSRFFTHHSSFVRTTRDIQDTNVGGAKICYQVKLKKKSMSANAHLPLITVISSYILNLGNRCQKCKNLVIF